MMIKPPLTFSLPPGTSDCMYEASPSVPKKAYIEPQQRHTPQLLYGEWTGLHHQNSDFLWCKPLVPMTLIESGR